MTDHVKALRDIAENPEPLNRPNDPTPDEIAAYSLEGAACFHGGFKYILHDGKWRVQPHRMHPK